MNKHERAIRAAGMMLPPVERDRIEAAVAAYLAEMRKPGPDEVRVRVCVGVNEGYWNAVGEAGSNDKRDKSELDDDEGGTQFHFIEANIPAWRPPVEETVEGEVAK